MNALKIISTYYGERRNANNNLLNGQECLEFLKLQIENEINLDPGCDMDLLIVNNDTNNPDFNQYLNSLNGTKIFRGTVLISHRENMGGSFGAFSHGYDLMSESYQYFLFNEDDIIITHPGYFKRAIDELNSDDTYGFIAFSPICLHGHPVHCGGGFGVTSKKILDTIKTKYGNLPYIHKNSYGDFQESEVMFTNNVIEVGYVIKNIDEWSPLAENYLKHSSQNREMFVTQDSLSKPFIYRVGK